MFIKMFKYIFRQQVIYFILSFSLQNIMPIVMNTQTGVMQWAPPPPPTPPPPPPTTHTTTLTTTLHKYSQKIYYTIQRCTV